MTEALVPIIFVIVALFNVVEEAYRFVTVALVIEALVTDRLPTVVVPCRLRLLNPLIEEVAVSPFTIDVRRLVEVE